MFLMYYIYGVSGLSLFIDQTHIASQLDLITCNLYAANIIARGIEIITTESVVTFCSCMLGEGEVY